MDTLTYIDAKTGGKTPNAFRKIVYHTMYVLRRADREQQEMGVEKTRVD
jgi:hypothetical protein